MKYRLDNADIFQAAVLWLKNKGVEVSGASKMTVVVEPDKKTGKLMPFVDIE